MPTAKRVSYVLPACHQPPCYFALPPLGADRRASPHPILVPSKRPPPPSPPPKPHPQHTLAVSSLAIDTTTCIAYHRDHDYDYDHHRDHDYDYDHHRDHDHHHDYDHHHHHANANANDRTVKRRRSEALVPPGILYTGGRDGLVGAWELHLPMQRQTRPTFSSSPSSSSSSSSSRAWHPARSYEQDEAAGPHRRGSAATPSDDVDTPWRHAVAEAQQWKVDPLRANRTPPTRFRQCIQSHTDWINDILLCNHNQTLVSASSDRAVRFWNPHDPQSSLSPQMLGTHKDYVKALAYAAESGYVASGGFDKCIKLWDVRELRPAPLFELGEKAVKTSVYALSVNPSGSVLAGGSPEQHVRVWDPRSGQKCAELIGHTDNIRSVLVSDDGRHLLSGSADSTVRLWSLGEQRCLHTFTHHADSVWSLFSDHPDLDVFYSGDRQGYVCKVDWERCAEVSEGECVVLCRERDEDEDLHGVEVEVDADADAADGYGGRRHGRTDAKAGIQKIVALDDTYFWTATGSSSVHRWRDVPRRAEREALYPLGGSHRHQPGPFGRPSTGGNTNPLDGSSVEAAAPADRSDGVGIAAQPLSKRPSARFGGLAASDAATATLLPPKGKAASSGSADAVDDAAAALSAGMNLPPGDVEPSATMHGIPFDSLVSLAPISDPYGDQIGLGSVSMRDLRGYDDDAAGSNLALRAAMSRLSIDQSRPSLSYPSLPPAVAAVHPQIASLQAMEGHARPASTRSASLRFAPMQQTLDGVARSWRTGSVDGSVDGDEEREQEEDGDEGDGDQDDDDDDEYDNDEDDEDATYQKRLAFEDRELADEARPLRMQPDDTIQGSHGLIRSAMLNNRRHVLAISSAGAVTLWDVIKGVCLGEFDADDVREAALQSSLIPASLHERWRPQLTPGDTLEAVKERIEGQGVTPLWCAVDTKSGALTVHLEEPRCFEAEFYIDEFPDCADLVHFKEDQRGQAAKWILRNLFAGFVYAEEQARGWQPARSGHAAAVTPGLDRILHANRRRPSMPGMTIALATPAKTPAFTPGGGALLTSSAAAQRTPHAPPSSQAGGHAKAANGGATTGGDYFSFRSAGSSAANQTPSTAKPTVATASENNGGQTTDGAVAPTPGGSGLMSKLRFGKSKADKVATPNETASEADNTSAKEDRMTDEDKEKQAHAAMVQQLLSQPISPLPMNEVPELPFSPETALIISESSADAGSWEVVYRGLVSSAANDVEVLEERSPLWLLELLLCNRVVAREPVKLSFTLQPWISSAARPDGFGGFGDGSLPMPDMPSGNARLTATRCLRIKKACNYVCEKLELASPQSRANSIVASRRSSTDVGHRRGGLMSPPSQLSMTVLARQHEQQREEDQSTQPATGDQGHHDAGHAHGRWPDAGAQQPQHEVGEVEDLSALPPHEVVEIVCNDQVMPHHVTLAQCQRFFWRSTGDIKLEYRLKRPWPHVDLD